MFQLKNDKGFTLIELLAVITLTSIITIATVSLITQATSRTTKIQNDTFLRDEADYLMSLVVRNIYTTLESNIEEDSINNFLKVKIPIDKLPASEDPNNCIDNICEVITGFKTTPIDSALQTDLYVNSEKVNITNNSIKIDPNSTFEKVDNSPAVSGDTSTSPTYLFKIGLYFEEKDSASPPQVYWFENEINSINDLIN